ncbi:MAG: tRNA (adenosine(37)-N6)-dimethylallyltransferase MiaA [Gammaproteobacteria bacterium]
MDQPVIFLMGPTAAGKTGLAVDLVQHLPLEIISVDSAMVYRGMDIGTAKPPPEVLRIAPHRLIDICDPSEVYSAARFRSDAMRCIEELHGCGKIPLLVGGTGLYFRALEQGLSELPSGNTEVRRRLVDEAAKAGWETLHARLAKIDPKAAARIHPHDPQRIQRALEVYLLTGRSLTEHHRAILKERIPYRVIKIIMAPSDRSTLHTQAELRFLRMLDAGLVEEVRRLRARGDLHAGLPALRLVGYRQVWNHLEGLLSFAAMTEKAVIATRQLIKRQLTWLRKEQGGHWYDSLDSGLRDKILEFLENRLKTGQFVI